MKPSRGSPGDEAAVASAPRRRGADGRVRLDEAGYRMLTAIQRVSRPDGRTVAAIHQARAGIASDPVRAHRPRSDPLSGIAAELEPEPAAAPSSRDRRWTRMRMELDLAPLAAKSKPER